MEADGEGALQISYDWVKSEPTRPASFVCENRTQAVESTDSAGHSLGASWASLRCIDELACQASRPYQNDHVKTQSALRHVSDRQTRGAGVTFDDLKILMAKFARNTDFSSTAMEAQVKCRHLFEKDYHIGIISNEGGQYCATYPRELLVLERERRRADEAPSRVVNDTKKLAKLFHDARFSRVRSRFAVPCILVRGQNICRSATLSHDAEILLQTVTESTRRFVYGRADRDSEALYSQKEEIYCDNTSSSTPDFSLTKKFRNADMKLLEQLKVKQIADLMVERKKVKYGFHVCSSEKAEKDRPYQCTGFDLFVMPYPGVEFFRCFKENAYDGLGLIFDWQQPFVDAEIDIPPKQKWSCDWSNYRQWDIILLTRNYLKLLLKLVSTSDQTSGLLIHCISGWDRTPLFVSLMRISLWADGEIHQTLSALEILYLTIAYDWCLFGHLLSDRMSRGEEIFLFCFYFLQFITSDEFSYPQASLVSATSTSAHVRSRRRSDASIACSPISIPLRSRSWDAPRKKNSESWQVVSLGHRMHISLSPESFSFSNLEKRSAATTTCPSDVTNLDDESFDFSSEDPMFVESGDDCLTNEPECTYDKSTQPSVSPPSNLTCSPSPSNRLRRLNQIIDIFSSLKEVILDKKHGHDKTKGSRSFNENQGSSEAISPMVENLKKKKLKVLKDRMYQVRNMENNAGRTVRVGALKIKTPFDSLKSETAIANFQNTLIKRSEDDVQRLIDNFSAIIEAAASPPNMAGAEPGVTPPLQSKRECVDIEIKTANIVRSVQSLLQVTADLKAALILNDVNARNRMMDLRQQDLINEMDSLRRRMHVLQTGRPDPAQDLSGSDADNSGENSAWPLMMM